MSERSANRGAPTPNPLSTLAWALAGALALLGAPTAIVAQELGVETNLDGSWIRPDAAIELRFDRPLQQGERVGVFLDDTDLTHLFRTVPGGMRYMPRVVPLPPGESDLTVYRVDTDGDWHEVARAPVRVLISELGLETARADVRLDLGLQGRLAEGHDPEDLAPDRSTYQDFTGQFNLNSEIAGGAFRGGLEASLIGVSRREDALRFGRLGADATKIDLSSYRFRAELGPSDLSVGHVSLGRQRHLISSFSSRGARLSAQPLSRLDLAVGVTNGSSVVGWDNFFGMDDPDHRIVSGTVGLEVLERPGTLRLELTGMDGSVRPLAGFNQGVVNDAEESRGLAVRLQAADPWVERLQFEAGLARSRFVNPDDPLLARDTQLVAVEEETRGARYANASLDVLRDLRLGGGQTASLSVGYRHERVDPLYRSVTAFTQADRLNNEWDVRASAAGISVTASHARSEDNLDRVPSILKTLTRRTGLDIRLPLPSFLQPQPLPWLPTLAYRLDRTHQFGTELPEGGGFEPSHLPDQVSLNQTATADWRWKWLTFGYRLNRSHQDNRQEGRADADFTTQTHGLALGLSPIQSLSANLSLDLERAENHERDEIDRTRRLSLRSGWSPFRSSQLTVGLSWTGSEDDAGTRERSSTRVDAQWSSFIPGVRILGGQYVLRFAWNIDERVDRTFELDDRREMWSLESGLNFGF